MSNIWITLRLINQKAKKMQVQISQIPPWRPWPLKAAAPLGPKEGPPVEVVNEHPELRQLLRMPSGDSEEQLILGAHARPGGATRAMNQPVLKGNYQFFNREK